MRQEVFEIVQKMDKDNIRTQMALQCAPLITGLKVANLLIIPSNQTRENQDHGNTNHVVKEAIG